MQLLLLSLFSLTICSRILETTSRKSSRSISSVIIIRVNNPSQNPLPFSLPFSLTFSLTFFANKLFSNAKFSFCKQRTFSTEEARKPQYFLTFCHERNKTGGLLKPPVLERMMGVEPTLSAWEAGVLPINYIRNALGLLQYSIVCRKIQAYS